MLSNQKIKVEISIKIKNFQNRLIALNGEIVTLDRNLLTKRQEFLRIEGAIKGLEMALEELNVDDEDVQGESEDKE